MSELILDSMVLALPPRTEPPTALTPDLEKFLTHQAHHVLERTMGARYVTLVEARWTLATTVEEAEAWTPPHDCADCRDGKARAVYGLASGMTKAVALGTVYWEEADT